MFGIASIVAFAVSWVFYLAQFTHGQFFTWQSFALLGLLCLAIHVTAGWPSYVWPWKRS